MKNLICYLNFREWDVFGHFNTEVANTVFVIWILGMWIFFCSFAILTVETIQWFNDARISVDKKDWKMRENLKSTHTNLLRGWMADWLVFVYALVYFGCIVSLVLCIRMYVCGIKLQCILYNMSVPCALLYNTIQYNLWCMMYTYISTDRIYWMWIDTVEQTVCTKILERSSYSGILTHIC